MILLTPRFVAESRAEGETRAFDVAGAVSVTAGLALLVYALVNTDCAGWGSTETIGLLAGAAVLLVAFVVDRDARRRRRWCRSASSACAP